MNQEGCTPGSIEEALMQELRFGGLDKDNLKELVGLAATIHKAGLKGIKVFPKGQPPAPDSLRLSGIVSASEIHRFLSEILVKTPRLSGLDAFPYGIPYPDFFRVRIGLGSPVAAPDPDGDPALF